MPEQRDEFLPTRQSLLERLKRWDDHESWRDFFNSYGGLLYRTAVKAGLNDSEAQDVVQETIIAVAKKIDNFRYDPAKDSFKGWLLYLTRKQIALVYRKRERNHPPPNANEAAAQIERIADPAGASIEAVWEEEWTRAIWEEALAKVKDQAGAKQFQMFQLYAVKEIPAADVAKALGVPVAQVYLAKHRVSAMLKKELIQLKAKLE
jgi:RNA polymerase sigma-70 factor (ECF subfamily)